MPVLCTPLMVGVKQTSQSSFIEERKLGTLELVFSWPVRDGELLAGKFLAALLVYTAMLAATAIGPLVLYALHPFAPGPVVAGYLGMLLLGVAFVACGTAASTVTVSPCRPIHSPSHRTAATNPAS